MSGELQAQHVTGATLYAVLVDATGGVWNGAAFDATPTSGEWATYDIAMAEQGGSGYYAGDLPAVGAGRYGYRVHKQVGGSPAATDPVIWTGELDTNETPAAALVAYDPPTNAELTAGLAAADDTTLAAIAALNNLSSADAQAAATAALTAYDPPTHAEMTAELATADDATLAAIAARPSVADFWSGITATAARFIADHTLRRSWASAAASADGDALGFRSLLGAVAKLVNRVGISGATLTVYESDDTTALGTQTVTSDAAAEPVTGVNTV